MSHHRNITVDYDVEATMRDGVVLRADVYRPVGEGPFPVVLSRTPYNKSAQMMGGFDPLILVRFGFIVVIQDVRGRYASDGDWQVMETEREDGYDSVEWAAALPGANGRVGMYGASYIGTTQWAAAVAGAPSLKAIIPALTWRHAEDGLVRRGGALDIGLPAYWLLLQGFDHLARTSTPEEHPARFEQLTEAYDTLGPSGYWELPARDLPPVQRAGIPTDTMDPAAIAGCSYTDDDFAAINDDVAVAATGGWYDLFIQGTIDTYVAARARGLDARLHIGPWSHAKLMEPIGERYFGHLSNRDTFMVDYSDSWMGRHLAWYARHLGPAEEVPLPEKRVRIFVMGRNVWRDEDDWPLARAVDQKWFLHADGTLAPDGPDGPDGPDTANTGATAEFTYDPADPVPTHGGQIVLIPGHPEGPLDQQVVEAREDVLVYTSEPMAEDLEVTGRITARLTVDSDAPSTDWVARLCDVDEDGVSYNLTDGIVRVTEGADQVRQVEVDLWSTSNVFLAGHRIRVHVTSSCFPRWDRNLNTGDQSAPQLRSAVNRVHHAGEGSWLELPVVRD